MRVSGQLVKPPPLHTLTLSLMSSMTEIPALEEGMASSFAYTLTPHGHCRLGVGSCIVMIQSHRE